MRERTLMSQNKHLYLKARFFYVLSVGILLRFSANVFFADHRPVLLQRNRTAAMLIRRNKNRINLQFYTQYLVLEKRTRKLLCPPNT
jgi:hypothetical protein